MAARNTRGSIKMERHMRNVVVCVVACCALKAVAVNAIDIVPIPSPIECKTDVTRPVALDETVTVAVDCPDAAAAQWLESHFKEWYGVHAPKVASCAMGTSRPVGEAYAVDARPESGIRIAAEAKHRKGGETPDPEPEPTPEPDGDAPVS